MEGKRLREKRARDWSMLGVIGSVGSVIWNLFRQFLVFRFGAEMVVSIWELGMIFNNITMIL